MIEYTNRLEFDVLTAPLAEIDRRTLSQAWYSALHLANAPAGWPSHRAARVAPASLGRATTAVASARAPRASVADARAVRATREPAICEVAADRRAPRSQLACRIERIVARPVASMHGAFFTLRGAYGRVQILLRSHGGRTHVVAVCSPEARAEVAHALDQARYTLARGGIAACAVRVREAAR
jgi:hypothetical protein